MPISEDEYDHRQTSYEPSSSTMSKAELRKTHKPIMEKRRRARINHCLNEIKSLILDAMKKDPARHSKLEKADILEMAVKHLQNVQRQQLALAMATDPSVLRKFKAGFNECADEVTRYINNLEGLDANIQHKISQHLAKCISGIEQIVHLNFPGFGGVPFLSNTSSIFAPSTPVENHSETSGDQNNNPNFQMPTNLQLIPSRLATGELALLVPNSSNLPCFPNNSREASRPSAFVAVIPSGMNNLSNLSPTKQPSRLLSPPQSPTISSGDLISNNNNAPSPHGFRPVASSQRSQINPLSHHPEPQHSVTSTSASPKKAPHQTEVKSIRFPIQKTVTTVQPQRLIEPLSIITNHTERYKQAHVLEESAHYEENFQRGVKRKSESLYPSGLLAVAPTKILKTVHGSNVADYKTDDFPSSNVIKIEILQSTPPTFASEVKDNIHKPLQYATTSQARESNAAELANDNMWRPW